MSAILSPEIYVKSIASAQKHWAIPWIKEAWGEKNYQYFFNMILTTELEKEELIEHPRRKPRPKRRVRLDIYDRMQCKKFDAKQKERLDQFNKGEAPLNEILFSYYLAFKENFIQPVHSKEGEIERGMYSSNVMLDWNNSRVVHSERYV